MKQLSLFPEKEKPLPYRAVTNGIELFVRATPKASKSCCKGVFYDSNNHAYLKIYVTDVAENNQANEAIIKFLSDLLDIPKTYIFLKSGHTQRLKTFYISQEFELKKINNLCD